MKIRLSILIVLIIFLFSCSRDREKNVVALVEDEAISIEKFQDKYSKFLFKTGIKDNLKYRHDFLKLLIDEIALFQYINESGFLQKPEIREKLNIQKDQVCLNYYFKEFMYKELTVTDQEILEAYKRSKIKIRARHLFAISLEKANNLKSRLDSGKKFEELAGEIFRDPILAANYGDIGWFTLGMTDPAFENVAYQLETGEISEPVKTRRGYSIIQVLEKQQDGFATEEELQIRRKWLESEVKRQKFAGFFEKKTDKIFSDMNMKFNKNAVEKLYVNIETIKNEIFAGNLIPEIKFEEMDGNILESDNQNWTLRDTYIKLAELQKDQWDRIKTHDDFQKALKGLAIREEIERRIEEEEIADIPQVNEQIRNSIFERSMHEYMIYFADTVKVRESQIEEYYREHRDEFITQQMFQVAEIVVKDSMLALECLEKLDSGVEFAKIAKDFSIEERSSQLGGYLGWGTKSQFGEFDDLIAALNPEEIMGPIKIRQKYYILKKLDEKDPVQLSLAESNAMISAKLLPEIREKSYINFVRELRKMKKIIIKNDILKNLNINTTRGIS